MRGLFQAPAQRKKEREERGERREERRIQVTETQKPGKII